MDSIIHPTQKRLSCDNCRKRKTKCLRQRPHETKCSRCKLLGQACTIGQQKKVGRPRSTSTSSHVVTRNSSNISTRLNDSTSYQAPDGVQGAAAFSEDNTHPSGGGALSAALTTPLPLPLPIEDSSSEDTEPLNGIELLDPALPNGKNSLFWNGPYETLGFLPSIPMKELDQGLVMPTSPSSLMSGANVSLDSQLVQLHSGTITDTEAMAELSKINIGLHVRVSTAEINKLDIDFDSICYRTGPLYLGQLTLVQFILGASQDFLMILNRLREARFSRCSLHAQLLTDSLPSPEFSQAVRLPSQSDNFPRPLVASKPLSATLALMITSIFVQLIMLYELNLKHVIDRIDRLEVDPIFIPIPGLAFEGLSVTQPCTQGMQFSEAIVSILERIERSLGIGMVPDGGDAGLFSVRQMHILWNELQVNTCSTGGWSSTRVHQVKHRFRAVYTTLKQVLLI